MMQALDVGVGNLTSAYRRLGLFDDTVFLFLADNGGIHSAGGFNVPLRGQKATVWEGGLRSQTFVHWSGFDARVAGSIHGGLAHAVDWGVTLEAALLDPTAGSSPPALGWGRDPSISVRNCIEGYALIQARPCLRLLS